MYKEDTEVLMVPIDDGIQAKIRQIEHDTKEMQEITKSLYGKQQAYAEPFLEMMDTNPDYRDKRSYMRNAHNLHEVLKKFGNNIIVPAIINTRFYQVSLYCQPARYSEKGVGFEVIVKDLDQTPGIKEKEQMKRIEEFILNTGTDKDIDRDSFLEFCKKIVRDTYTYDQVNFEKVFATTNKTKGEKFIAVDPSTRFYATDIDGKIIKGGNRFVQVIDKQVVASFTSRELVMGIRNPRSDLNSSGYGLSDVEIAMKEFIAYNNTESLYDRFFRYQGKTRGILQIRADQQQSQHAVEKPKREWKSSFSGINGSWQVPVMMADDKKFVNMTPTANDMQFEKWLNVLIKYISALYGIDPSEIGFPDKGGGATGSKGGSSLNESDPTKTPQQSMNKGLPPLLRFIEELINRHIISEVGDKYTFQFVVGDTKSELDVRSILQKEKQVYKTVNEAGEEQGLKPIDGGDVICHSAFLQSTAQEIQKDQYLDMQQKERLQLLMSYTKPQTDEPTDDSKLKTTIQEVRTDNQKKGDDNVYRTQTSNKGQGRKGEKSSDFM
ncbi:portal protein [Staphylococcus phage vB_SauH_DELF3]|nr:portal protein [Staphylococcus phage vB_SauH_DELF3]